VSVCHLHECLGEVLAGDGVILDDEDVGAVGEVLQALHVPGPGIGWDGGVLAYLHRERAKTVYEIRE
jgi:hypothetical protein